MSLDGDVPLRLCMQCLKYKFIIPIWNFFGNTQHWWWMNNEDMVQRYSHLWWYIPIWHECVSIFMKKLLIKFHTHSYMGLNQKILPVFRDFLRKTHSYSSTSLFKFHTIYPRSIFKCQRSDIKGRRSKQTSLQNILPLHCIWPCAVESDKGAD